MKIKLIVATFVITTGWLLYQSLFQNAHSNTFGAPVIGNRGYTGSITDGRTCAVSGCHSGTVNTGPGMPAINTDIPADGYRRGETYNITAIITEPGRTRFGFQMTSENSFGNKAGRFTADADTRSSSDFYITQSTNNSSSMGSGMRQWSFEWTAPTNEGTGPVTLYAAFNSANNNGRSTGDNIYSTTLEIQESIFSGREESSFLSTLSLYPQPALDRTNLSLTSDKKLDVISFQVISANGQLMDERTVSVNGFKHQMELEVSNYSPGIYFIRLQHGAEFAVQKLVVQER